LSNKCLTVKASNGIHSIAPSKISSFFITLTWILGRFSGSRLVITNNCDSRGTLFNIQRHFMTFSVTSDTKILITAVSKMLDFFGTFRAAVQEFAVLRNTLNTSCEGWSPKSIVHGTS
jgi:hypothetical protein